MYSNDKKADMILICGECRKNAVQPAHVRPISNVNGPISNVFG
jgi:hypothetical protein